jgi:hypothetical protein
MAMELMTTATLAGLIQTTFREASVRPGRQDDETLAVPAEEFRVWQAWLRRRNSGGHGTALSG